MRLWNEGSTLILFSVIFLVIVRDALNWNEHKNVEEVRIARGFSGDTRHAQAQVYWCQDECRWFFANGAWLVGNVGMKVDQYTNVETYFQNVLSLGD